MESYRISPLAQSDLDQLWDYIAGDDPTQATQFVARIVDHFAMLARQPLIGTPREDLARRLRDFTVGNYVILYRPVERGDTAVEIVRVLHSARDVQRLL